MSDDFLEFYCTYLKVKAKGKAVTYFDSLIKVQKLQSSVGSSEVCEEL